MAASAFFLCAASSASARSAAQTESEPVERREVEYRNGEVTLAATLLIPEAAEPVPAVVIVHGSGSSTRDNPWTRAYAEDLASRGIAVLHPDKRGGGESGGDWRTASVADLAGDVSAGIAFLRERPEIDRDGIGVIGFSQGGYVVAQLAAEEPCVAFSAVISGGTASMCEQIVDELVLEAERREQPLDEEELARLHELYRMLFTVARKPEGWDAYVDAVTQAQEAGGPLGHALRTMPLDASHWAVAYLRHMGDFDPMPFWRRVEGPVLFVYGGRDTQVQVDASVRRLRAAPTRDLFTIVTAGGNGHALFRADVNAMLAAWIRARGIES